MLGERLRGAKWPLRYTPPQLVLISHSEARALRA